MTHRFFDIAFTDSVKQAQGDNGSAAAYSRHLGQSDGPDLLSLSEITFIRESDSFYMATVSETNWPYVQHRGGPAGFVKILDAATLGVADYRGNRQYVSLGNIEANDRACLFFMDYVGRRRLKVLAQVKSVDLKGAPDLAEKLVDDDYGAKVERGFVFTVEAFDWNCPQHITPRSPGQA